MILLCPDPRRKGKGRERKISYNHMNENSTRHRLTVLGETLSQLSGGSVPYGPSLSPHLPGDIKHSNGLPRILFTLRRTANQDILVIILIDLILPKVEAETRQEDKKTGIKAEV